MTDRNVVDSGESAGCRGERLEVGDERLGGDFPAEEFVARRARICEEIGSDAYALVVSAPPPRGFVVFQQSKQFFYCCGLETPQAYLLMEGGTGTSALYLHPRGNAALEEGAPPGLEDAALVRAITGVETVYPIAKLADHLAEARYLYTSFAPMEVRAACRHELVEANRMIAHDPWDGRPTREYHLVSLLRSRYPNLRVLDLTPILDEMRSIKSPREVDVMRRAGRLCARAVREAMRVTQPGVIEYELGALATMIYTMSGAQGEGYRPIIATGRNIWYGHYFRNDAALKAGELVLMDVAPECHHYTSDIGRMWPVSGSYLSWQRELYGYIVEYHKVLLSTLRPGLTPDAVMDEAAEMMHKVWEGWSFSKSIYREAARRTLAYRGHLSHPVGLVVHDDGEYDGRPLVPGTVFTVDPQMWIPEEKRYIRVEDTVVVTEDGIEVLTQGAPLELDAVEALMAQEPGTLPYWEGMGQ
jgi:Xaa-Pro aminopeptidase